MTKQNTLNIRLSNSQLNKLKPGIKSGYQIWSEILKTKLIFHINYY